MARNSWRFNFINENLSQFDEPEQSVGTLGYMVVRAPKGETKALYFPAGAADMIKNLIGVPSADYPDIQEAIEFNRNYGLYISAPAGNSAKYPSYFGGQYFTKVGALPFYKVTNKDNPNFEAAITFGNEKVAVGAGLNATVDVILNTKVVGNTEVGFSIDKNNQGAIVIDMIDPEVFKKVQHIDFNFWGNSDQGCPAGTYRYYLDKATNGIYACDANGAKTNIFCGYFEKVNATEDVPSHFKVVLGGDKASAAYEAANGVPVYNKYTNAAVPFIDFNSLVNYLDYWNNGSVSAEGGEVTRTNVVLTHDDLDEITSAEADKYFDAAGNAIPEGTDLSAKDDDDNYIYEGAYYVVESVSESNSFEATEFTDEVKEKVRKYILEGGELADFGGSLNNEPKTYSSPIAPLDVVAIYDLTDLVYFYVVQKTPTSWPTVIKVKDVTYDKYEYDLALPFANEADPEPQYDSNNKLINGIKPEMLEKYGVKAFVNIYGGKMHIYEWRSLGEDEETGDSLGYHWEDVANEYSTKRILLSKLLGEPDVERPGFNEKNYAHKIFKVQTDADASGNCMDLMTVGNSIEDLALKENIAFNSFTASCEEADYTNTIVSGGEWTGSLDEGGEDEFGGMIYWKDILPNDSATFIELHPIKKFDDDLDADGYFTKRRLDSANSFTIVGERYVSKVVEELNEGGKYKGKGGLWNAKYGSIIKAGLVEATSPLYEEVAIFMEPTGNNDMKDYMPAITKAHEMGAVVAPLTISATQFANTATIAVPVRGRNIAYTVGEFQFYDKNTRTRYYSGIIGSYGAMLAKIVDEFYGAVAPAWKNDRAVGGELNRDGILAAKWEFTDDDTKIMDKKNINPILLSADNEVMVVSQKNTELDAGDWSYLGHSLSFNLCKREIRDEIMVDQLMKPIDDYWIGKQSEKGETIVGKRLEGSRPAWTAAKINCKKLNTPATKAKRMFIIQAVVQVTPFSEGVTLVFTNIGQEMKIEDF